MTDTLGGRYAVEAVLGQGGMGKVLRARDVLTDQRVAIKQLLVEMAHPELLERFRREGEALRALQHPNIVMFLDAFEDSGTPYLVMEYLPGGDLSGLLHGGPLDLARGLRLAIDLADALTRAHKLDIIHRDLKPANVLIAADGTLKLSDFGIAHFGRQTRVTGTQDLIGTVDYMAPELLRGEEPDARSDIWAFGVMLFEMAAGRRPFAGTTIGHVVDSILRAPLPDLEALCPDLPSALHDLIYRMLDRDRKARLPSVRIVGVELEAILGGRSDSPTKPRPPASTPDFGLGSPLLLRRKVHNLPAQTTAFVGREAELEELHRLLHHPTSRLITIQAPGGMGKTRLSIECGERNLAEFADGVYFVSLAALSDPTGILSAVAEATEYRFQVDGRDQKQQILDYLSNKQMLLILDNFEHLMAGTSLVAELLAATRSLRILVTSRQRLNQTGETVFSLGAIDFPDWETPADALQYAAVQLFLNSARRIQPDFELGDRDLASVAHICRLAQGMPLAILLAASWISTLTPGEIAAEMQANLDFLESDYADLPERQRSMRAVFDYSWNLLTEAEQQVFSRLSVFRGGFTREAAQEVAGASLRMLMTLINRSLLFRDQTTGRYSIHELVRQYGQEKLEHSGAYEEIRAGHSQYYARFVSERERDLKGRRQFDGLNELDADFDNVTAAWHALVDQGSDTILETMIEGVYWYCVFRTELQSAAMLFDAGRTRWTKTSAETSPLICAKLHARFSAGNDLSSLYEWCMQVARHHHSEEELAFCLRMVGLQRAHVEIRSEGLTLLQQSLAIYERLSDSFNVATVLDELGWGHFLVGTSVERIACIERALDLRRSIGDRIGTANALRNLAAAHWMLDTPRTLLLLEDAYAIGVEMGDRAGVAWTALILAAQHLVDSRLDKASALTREALALAEAMNVAVLKSLAYLISGWELGLREDYQQGMMWTTRGMALAGDGIEADRALIDFIAFSVCVNAAGLGDYARIEETLHQLYERFPVRYGGASEISDFLVANSLCFMPFQAGKLAQTGQAEGAAEILGAAIGHPLWVLNWHKTWGWLIRLQADLRTALGEEGYQQAWERGRQMDVRALVRDRLLPPTE
ncbi:MAG: protein kinase [Anaerolineae bacterium]|nr:protein kinase [Anaerolineae bacterium]